MTYLEYGFRPLTQSDNELLALLAETPFPLPSGMHTASNQRREMTKNKDHVTPVVEQQTVSTDDPAERPRFAWAYKNKYDPQTCVNTPKSAREQIAVQPVPALSDPQKLLGHGPRPRKKVRRL